jgi:hypothetical protein
MEYFVHNCTIVLLHSPNTPLLHRASLHLERSEIPREDVSKLSVLLFFVILSAAKNLINIQVEFLHSVQDDKIQPFETASIQERHHCITVSLYD